MPTPNAARRDPPLTDAPAGADATASARTRLDAELARRGLARSRAQASEFIRAGRVRVAGRVVERPAARVDSRTSVSVSAGPEPDWVSRAALKLVGALQAWPDVVVAGCRCLDAGSSTGGFTQVLLARGAAHVDAVDVGRGQFDPVLARDPRVTLREQTDIRTVTVAGLGAAMGLIVADLSFIGLHHVLPALAGCLADGGELLVLVKPQFEVGRDGLGRGGVVRNSATRHAAVLDVARTATRHGLRAVDVVRSIRAGVHGNVEYVLRLHTARTDPTDRTDAQLAAWLAARLAVAETAAGDNTGTAAVDPAGGTAHETGDGG